MKHQIAFVVLYSIQLIAVLFANVESGEFNNPESTVKQCTFENLDDGRDRGQIATCLFRKMYSKTALRVTYQGDLRVVTCANGRCCRRWYITINGKECSDPAPIDAVVYASKNGNNHLNLHRPATLDGFCNNIPDGKITVGLSVGKCKFSSYDIGNAYTCWGSVCRFIIEERPPLQ
ncbi:collagen triple helix repeat-containing protein 1-like [Dendronephthya gigantea]|uniref:collagen triple helix repeat-containing protein 1-like n=1 Tax=Dendronephthya gigantea TaxID=151771 RepID=UPI00106D6212|nr:collagen triple helix repeat-containing protein 1-like [Dendronephthya gigantea]